MGVPNQTCFMLSTPGGHVGLDVNAGHCTFWFHKTHQLTKHNFWKRTKNNGMIYLDELDTAQIVHRPLARQWKQVAIQVNQSIKSGLPIHMFVEATVFPP